MSACESNICLALIAAKNINMLLKRHSGNVGISVGISRYGKYRE